jgi:UTP--glucose-1-phosphate uridylyltransferase
MIHLYEETGKQVIGVNSVPTSEVNKYGIISSSIINKNVHDVFGLVEKPEPSEAPSNMAIMGRYVLNPSIFPILKSLEKGAGGEYQLTDALQKICILEGLLALELSGNRYDIGDKLGYLKAIMEIGLQREDLFPQLLPYLKGLIEEKSKMGQHKFV